MLTALTRAVSPRLGDCELTFLARCGIDVAQAQCQHQAYQERLRQLGVQIVSVPAAPELPDGVFVEDTAVVVDEVAVMASMGAASRREEVESVARVLAAYRPLAFLTDPARLDGGDVLRVDRTLYVGASQRTNHAAITQLRDVLAPYGYTVQPVAVTGCLHLKTGCSYLGRNTLLANRSWIDSAPLSAFDIVDIAPGEPGAANALVIGDVVLLPGGSSGTAALLEQRGFDVETLDISELEKAEAGLTCLSIIFRDAAEGPGSAD